MGDFVFLKQLFHLFGDHVAVIRDGDQRNFFPGLRLILWFPRLGLFTCFTHTSKYTPDAGSKGELFEGFQGGFFGERPLAAIAGYKVNGFPDRHGCAEIQRDPSMLTSGAGDLSKTIGNIRLGPKIKLHVRIDREAVETLLAHAPPFSVGLHKPLIDAETGTLTHSALHCGESRFDILDRGWRHRKYLPDGV